MRYLKNTTTGQLLLQYVFQYKTTLSFSLICILVSVLLRAVGPAVLKQGVDHLTPATLARYSLLLIGIAVVQGVAMFGQEQLLMRSASCIECDLRAALFNH